MRGHFRSRNKDGGRTIRSAIAENPMIHANLMTLTFIEADLWAIEVSHCENRDFRLFCSCDLDPDPMTFVYEVDPFLPDVHRMSKYELPTSRLSKVIV